jgi:hypothetical protein
MTSRGIITGPLRRIDPRHCVAALVGAISRQLCGALKYVSHRPTRN